MNVPKTQLAASQDPDDIFELARLLFLETATVMALSSSLQLGTDRTALPLKEAVCRGLLVRAMKLVGAINSAVETEMPRDSVSILHRSLFETVTNLRFLLLRFDEDAVFSQYVVSGLGPERELYDLVHANIRSRGGTVLPIETRMLTSIRNIVHASGLDIGDVPRQSSWGADLRQRLQALDVGQRYVGGQRIPSHAAHGTWVDLLMNHLRKEQDGFSVELASELCDARMLLPIAVLAAEATTHYLMTLFPWDAPEVDLLVGRLSNLRERLLRADGLHEELTQREFLNR